MPCTRTGIPLRSIPAGEGHVMRKAKKMDSFIDIQFEVESLLKKHYKDNKKTLWEELVDSSRKLNGAACDGFIMDKVEKYSEELLSKIDNKDMYNIWLETENGILAIEQGFDDPERCTMIEDIGIDILEQIAKNICQEAKKSIKKRKTKKIPHK